MKRKVISKLIGAGAAVAFFALVKPSHVPSMFVVSIFTLMIYELVSEAMLDILPRKKVYHEAHIGDRYHLSRWAGCRVGKD